MPTLLAPDVTDATRREFLALLGAAGLLAGCAADTSADAGPPTRTYRDATGVEVQIPVRPQRIAVSSAIVGGRLLVLGGPVVAMPRPRDDNRAELERVLGVDLSTQTFVSDGQEFDLEALTAVAPDLIVLRIDRGNAQDPASVERLRRIAPVVGLEAFNPLEASVDDALDLLGESATADVDAQRRDFDAALADLRAVLGDRWPELSAAAYYDAGGEQVFVNQSTGQPAPDVLTRLGVDWVPRVRESDAAGENLALSPELLGELSADLIVVGTPDGTAPTTELPVFAALPAAVAGQVVVLDQSFECPAYPTYAAVARLLAERLRAMGDIRTGLTA